MFSGKIMSRTVSIIFLLVVGVISFGCNSLQSLTTSDTAITFSIEDISVIGQMQDISVGGKATLPTNLQLVVSAVRPLKDFSGETPVENQPLYAILDRQFVAVENGLWQTQLKLREPDKNGVLFENWQLNPELKDSDLSPSSQVVFMLALEPTSLTGKMSQQLANASINNGETRLSYTSSGEAYLQVEQAIAMPVPTGTVALKDDETSSEYLQTWQPRSEYNPTVDSNENSRVTPFFEEDNLDLPAAYMLQ
jgi:hypothetical protein